MEQDEQKSKDNISITTKKQNELKIKEQDKLKRAGQLKENWTS